MRRVYYLRLFWFLFVGLASSIEAQTDSLNQRLIVPTSQERTTTIEQLKLDALSKQINDLTDENRLDKWIGWAIAIGTILSVYAAANRQTKGSSISNFRVKWIEDLRLAYTECYTVLQNVCHKMSTNTLVPGDPDLDKLRLTQTKIKLMLHHPNIQAQPSRYRRFVRFITSQPDDKEHTRFWRGLLRYIETSQAHASLGAASPYNPITIDNLRLELEKILLVIFKKEWDKAKRFK